VWKQAAPARDAAWNESGTAFSNGLIAIEELLFAVHKTRCERAADFKSAGNGFYFLLAEFASAPAGEHAIIMVHKFLPDGC